MPETATTTRSRLFHPGEPLRVALACGAFFLLLCSYYILRPVRDALAVQYGANNLQWLFSATLAATLLVVPLFGWVVRTVARPRVLPLVYGFLALNLLGFCIAFAGETGRTAPAIFFVWLSVFNLFVVSLFWSRLGDSFTPEQARRLYGYVAAGGTAGALTGPALTALLATRLETSSLLAISLTMLVAAAILLGSIPRNRADEAGDGDRPLGGSILAGIPLTVKRGRLRGVALIVLCYTIVSTVLYVELVTLAGESFAHREDRTRFFAGLDLTVNCLALLLQLLGTRKLAERGGVRLLLSTLPALLVVAFGLLGAWRSMAGFALAQTLHRAGEYALNKPGREMLLTAVDAHSRYKAKNFIDTAVYRTGDALASWLIAAARTAGLEAALAIGLPAALLWLLHGYRLGRQHDRSKGNASS